MGDNGRTTMASNPVYVKEGRQAAFQTPEGWLPAQIVICQRPNGSPAIIHGPGINVKLSLLQVVESLIMGEEQEKVEDDSPQATANRLRGAGFMLP